MIDPAIRRQYDDWGNADHLLSEPDRVRLDEGDWFRAAGECLCPICQRPYWRHPLVVGALWLHRLCTNELVHL